MHDALADADRLLRTDRPAGLRALTVLAEAGDRDAIVRLGHSLFDHPDDRAEAMAWLMRASAFGDAGSAWKVAMIHRDQRRVAEMRAWIDRAARLGDEGAIWVRRHTYDLDAFPDFVR